MAFVLPSESIAYEDPPMGPHPAICYRLIDLGTSEQRGFNGEPPKKKHQIFIGWELCGEDRMSDGRPYTVGKFYTYSMARTATLRKHLESWRGKNFTPDEMGPAAKNPFDLETIVGAKCILQLGPSMNGERVVVDSIGRAMKGLNYPDAPENGQIIFNLANYRAVDFEALPDSFKAMVMRSDEWQAINGNPPPAQPIGGQPTPPAGPAAIAAEPLSDVLDDDIPF